MKRVHYIHLGVLFAAIAALTAVSAIAQEPAGMPPHPGMCPPVPTQIRGVRDNFAPANGNEPNFQSPQVKQALAGKPQQGFDAGGAQGLIPQNQVFGTSFALGCCKVAKPILVTMNVRRNNTGQGGNDRAYLHLGTPAGIGNAVLVEDLWKNPPYKTQTARTVVFTVQPNQVNPHIFNNAQPFIDILMQDDSAVDFVMLQN